MPRTHGNGCHVAGFPGQLSLSQAGLASPDSLLETISEESLASLTT